MRIEENKVYMFTFETGEMGNLAIPIRGETREDAANKLQAMFGRMQMELAMEFPKVAPGAPQGATGSISMGADLPAAEGLTEILSERIDTLTETLGGKNLQPAAKAETIKNWSDLDYVPENYGKIIQELELIASGQKVVPPKSKKK